jgi:hypothetical protein
MTGTSLAGVRSAFAFAMARRKASMNRCGPSYVIANWHPPDRDGGEAVIRCDLRQRLL